jgi:uncharacterized protein YyaL (SSP411 family)
MGAFFMKVFSPNFEHAPLYSIQIPGKIDFMIPKHTNNLIHESSPYLLQHAHNPVHWEAWHAQVLQRAKAENKLLLISIGYAACHWCHVMEHECFEDEEVAAVMNTHFINIKIDREERPDIDHIYMDALQMMTGSGGWPLNVIALPDGRPFWGATFVKKPDWIRVLEQLAALYNSDPEKVIDYAASLADGIRSINLVENRTESPILPAEELDSAIKNWAAAFDTFLGGYKRAPKFMMPNNLELLLHYGTARKEQSILDYVHTSLTKMAYGGIFDHLGGGFSRYAVDTKWHVPHFEKMLYDNGQLISLYAKAFASTKTELYKKVVEETIAFVTEELMSPEHAFYSSLDADSLNAAETLEEGAFYVWTEKTLKEFLGGHYDIFAAFYNINSYGHWEHGNYVLIRDASESEIAEKHHITTAELATVLSECKTLLIRERNKRDKPRLDDKILTSWNGLMLNGIVDAYKYLGRAEYLELALNNAKFIEKNLTKADGSLFRNHKNGKSTINAYLEDYATVMEAYINLYQVCFDEKWLAQAKALLEYCLQHFFDEESQLFFFTSKKDDVLIRRTLEVNDNVISSSNSIMANNLFKLSRCYQNKSYEAIALKMLVNVQHHFEKSAQGYANWIHLNLFKQANYYEVAVVGPAYKQKTSEINVHYLPNTMLFGTEKDSTLALLQHRYQQDKTLLYVCLHGACMLPETEVARVLEKLQ